MTNTKIDYRLVDTAGQITAVVFDDYKTINISQASQKIMSQNKLVEQAAFLSKKGKSIELTMMGNELSINGILAGAFLANQSKIYVSALKRLVPISTKYSQVSCRLPLNIIKGIDNNFVMLEGIGYIISNDQSLVDRVKLSKLGIKYSLPAVGIVKYKRNAIRPFVYVKSTNSLIAENACGSGSLAYSVFSGFAKILQPSGKAVEVIKSFKSFTIKVEAKIVQ